MKKKNSVLWEEMRHFEEKYLRGRVSERMRRKKGSKHGWPKRIPTFDVSAGSEDGDEREWEFHRHRKCWRNQDC